MNPESAFTFICPVKTNSGNKALENLPFELAGLNAVKPLIVTSSKIVGHQAIRTLTGAFGDSGMTLGLFDNLPDAPDLALIELLKANFVNEKYDAIIALGGGKIADVAKVLNMAVSLKTEARTLSPQTPVRKHLAAMAVVLTPQADGLETSPYAHLHKMVFASEYLAPNLVVIDPRLAQSKERKTIAAAGLASLGRAIDAQVSPDKNPFREAYSFAAIRFLSENLPAAVRDPGNKKAALAVLNAVSMSGCAFSGEDTGVFHKLGQLFQDLPNMHPGMITGMCLPSVLDGYRKKGSYDLAAFLAAFVADDEFVKIPEASQSNAALVQCERFLSGLRATLGREMPQTLREAGMEGSMLDNVLAALSGDPDGAYLTSVLTRVRDAKPLAERKG